MAVLRNTIDVEVPPEVVFAELSDLRNEMRWSPKMRSVELLTGEPIGVGSQLRAQWAGSPVNKVVVTSFESPRRWVTEYRSWMLFVEVTMEITPTPAGSHVASTWKLRARGPFRPLTPMLARALQADVAASMRSAKTHLESVAGASDPPRSARGA